jgi:hypothetical protein
MNQSTDKGFQQQVKSNKIHENPELQKKITSASFLDETPYLFLVK